MFVSKVFIGTKHPCASLSLFTNKEWSDTKLHGPLLSHPQILRKMSQISGEPGVGGGWGHSATGTAASVKAGAKP